MKYKLTIAIGLVVVVAGSATALYFGGRSLPATHNAASVVSPSSPLSKLVGGQSQEVISEAESQLPSIVANEAWIKSIGLRIEPTARAPWGTLALAVQTRAYEVNALLAHLSNTLRPASANQNVGSVVTAAVSSIVANRTTYLDEALATKVLDSMLLAQAKATNSVVPYAQAKAQAEANYSGYLKQGSPPLHLLGGQTAKESFVSPNAITGLQDALTIMQMEVKIAGQLYGANGGINNRRSALAAWMAGHLAIAPITLSNSPVSLSQLPTYLPAVM
ncbi:MAG: hypothetical protein HKL81_07655 [Acidimicrobiaceae bacterium]|nr:hypothetical protein [Acidimicrobiaceae bacterium]